MSTVLSIPLREAFPAPRELQMTPPLVEAAQEVLLQGLGLLFELGNSSYARSARAPFDASVGQHYRHVLEHFQCLVKGARTQEINYDARERNPRLENEVTYASVATCDVLRAIKPWSEATLEASCRVQSSVSYSAKAASVVDSNIARELSYCVAHAIHHYAIIKLICSELQITLPPEFGYAPSTVKHMSSLAAD